MSLDFTGDMQDFFENGWNPARAKTPRMISEVPRQAVPFIISKKAWDQYNNNELYDMEVRMRDLFDEYSHHMQWRKYRRNRHFTLGELFERLYGRPYDSSSDAKFMYILRDLMKHYAIRITKGGQKIDGKKTSKNVYFFPAKSIKEKAPYSLKLRMEWYGEQGILPCHQNMQIKPGLEPGHARNPVTEKNMRKRSELQRQRYNEYQRKRRASIADGTWQGRGTGQESGPVSDGHLPDEDDRRSREDAGALP